MSQCESPALHIRGNLQEKEIIRSFWNYRGTPSEFAVRFLNYRGALLTFAEKLQRETTWSPVKIRLQIGKPLFVLR